MSRHLESEMDRLRIKLLSVAAMVEEMLTKVARALHEKDKNLAQSVIDTDDQVDQLEVEVEEDCLKILALHQPVAIDLRYLIGVLKMNNDIERIGDLTVNIAERTLQIIKQPEVTQPFDLSEMSVKTIAMLKQSLDALIRMDLDLAKDVMLKDDEIDALNNQMYTAVYAAIKENPQNVVALLNYLSASRHLERIADYTTNIAEDVIYMVDGSIVRHNPQM